VIQVQYSVPEYTNPGGVSTVLSTAFHRSLGSGIVYGTLLSNVLPPDQRFVRLRYYNTMIFPADEIP